MACFLEDGQTNANQTSEEDGNQCVEPQLGERCQCRWSGARSRETLVCVPGFPYWFAGRVFEECHEHAARSQHRVAAQKTSSRWSFLSFNSLSRWACRAARAWPRG